MGILQKRVRRLQSGLAKLRVDLSARNSVKGLFDPMFYRHTNPALADLSDAALLRHYLDTGWQRGLDPCAEFSVTLYLAANPDVAMSGMEPVTHYAKFGLPEGRDAYLSTWGREDAPEITRARLLEIEAEFEPQKYRQIWAGDMPVPDRALAAHFLVFGAGNGVRPAEVMGSPAPGSRNSNTEVEARPLQPVGQWLKTKGTGGAPKGPARVSKADIACAAPHFNAAFYREMNPDIPGNDTDLLAHYMSVGWKEGRDPSPTFSTEYYLETQPDIKEAGLNPFLHFILHGKAEGRVAHGPGPIKLPVSADANIVPRQFEAVLNGRDLVRGDVQPPENVDTARMRIHWVIPDFTRGAGGHMTIFRMVRLLEKFGHSCKIWIESPDAHQDADAAYQDIVKYFQCVGAEVDFVRNGFENAVGDVVVATGWSTAYLVAAVKGFAAKFYFVQDHEPEFYPMGSEYLLARKTYEFELACICAGPWLEQIMTEEYGRWARHFHLAYEPGIYHSEPEDMDGSGESARPTRIAVYARDHTARRCVVLALMACQLLGQKRDDFEVHFFGQENLDFPETNFVAYNHRVLDPAELARLYRSCDIGVCFSATNYSLVPQEMMACGLPVVELDVPSTRKVFPEDIVTFAGLAPEDIVAKLETLMDSPEKRRRQTAAATAWVEQFSWEKSAREVEAAFVDFLAGPPDLRAPVNERPVEVAMDVVIPTYNGMDELPAVIEALRGQRNADALRIHCIDSSSTDGTTEWLRDQPDIALTVIPQSEFQHGRTRNQAADQGDAEFIAFLTQDARPASESWASDILRMMRHYPDAAGLFGRHLPYPHHPKFVRDEINAHFRRMLQHPLALSKNTDPARWNSGDLSWRQFLHFYSDNNSAMRRSVWNDIPYPEVDYGEDQVWARDIIEAGYTKLYAPTAAVYHSHDYTPDETYKRAVVESSFFYTHFGYKLGAGTEADIAARVSREQKALRIQVRSSGIDPAEMTMREQNIAEKHRGWRDGRLNAIQQQAH